MTTDPATGTPTAGLEGGVVEEFTPQQPALVTTQDAIPDEYDVSTSPVREEKLTLERNLPVGVVGVANERIDTNATGEATFRLNGTLVVETVKADDEEIASGESVRVFAPGNLIESVEVVRAPGEQDTAAAPATVGADGTDFPARLIERDLGRAGEFTTDPLALGQTEAVLISAFSEEGEAFSISVEFVADGETLAQQSKTDTGLDTVTDGDARLVRKGAAIKVTVTPETNAISNPVNVFIDSHR